MMEPSPSTKRCPNCDHEVNTSTFPLHEAFCHRNLKVCPRCKVAVLVQSFKEHLCECSHDTSGPVTAKRGNGQLQMLAVPSTSCEMPHEVAPREEMDTRISENQNRLPCDMCGVLVPSDGLQDHLLRHTCEYCNTVVPDYDRHEHLEHFCSAAIRKCKYCELTFNNLDYISHVEACGSRTEKCENCMSNVTLKDMDDHTVICWQEEEHCVLDPFIPETTVSPQRRHTGCHCCCCSRCTVS